MNFSFVGKMLHELSYLQKTSEDCSQSEKLLTELKTEYVSFVRALIEEKILKKNYTLYTGLDANFGPKDLPIVKGYEFLIILAMLAIILWLLSVIFCMCRGTSPSFIYKLSLGVYLITRNNSYEISSLEK